MHLNIQPLIAELKMIRYMFCHPFDALHQHMKEEKKGASPRPRFYVSISRASGVSTSTLMEPQRDYIS